MKTNIILTLTVAATAALFSACGAPAANNTNTTKPANAAPATATTASPVTPATKADASAADGQVIKIEEAGIQVTAPKGWKFSKDGDDTVIKSEDEGIDFRFSVPADGDYEAAIKAAATEIDDYLKDVKVDKSGDKRTVAGMEATSMNGTAKNEGEEVAWNLTIIKAPKKPVLVNIYAAKSSIDKYAKETVALMESIKKL